MKNKKSKVIAFMYLIVFVVTGLFVYQRINKDNTIVNNYSSLNIIENSSNLYKIKPVYNIVNGKVVFKANFSDDSSGVKKVEYCLTSSTSTPSVTGSCWSTNNSFDLNCGTPYYVYARGTDNAGNVSVVAEYLDYFYASCYSPPPGTTPPPDWTPDPKPSGIVETSTNEVVSTNNNDCDASCYISNNAANWHDAANSDLGSGAIKAIQGALHTDNENYISENNVDYNYNANGTWTDNNNNVQNDKGASSGLEITETQVSQTRRKIEVETANGDTVTVKCKYGRVSATYINGEKVSGATGESC